MSARSLPSLGLNRWDFSTPESFAEEVRFAESLGYGHALLGTNALRVWDTYIMLAIAALRTDRIKLATFVDNPVLRHPALLANAIATVDHVSGGRAELGIGVGDTAVRFLGRSPARVAELEEATTLVRSLLDGKEVDFGTGRAIGMDIARPVPVWVAAAGPRSLRAAGRTADGVYLRVGRHPANLRAALAAVHAGAKEVGRDPDEIRIGLVLHVVVSKGVAAASVARSVAAGFYEYSPSLFKEAGLDWPGPDIEELKKVVWPDFHHADDLVAAGDVVDFLPASTAEAFALTGPPDQIAAQLSEAIGELGRVDVVVPQPIPSPISARDFATWFARDIWPHVDVTESARTLI